MGKYEYTDAEIAEALGIPKTTVKMIFNTAMKKLRRGLKERGISIDDMPTV